MSPEHRMHAMSSVMGGYPGAGAWTVVLVSILVLLLYLLALTRLHERGDAWVWSRTAAAVGACVTMSAAVLLPYADPSGSFSLSVVQHLLMAMAAPALLALAAPVLLTLRTVPQRPRRLLLAVVHSRYLRVLTLAPVVLVLDLGGLYLYYLTSFFDWAHQSQAAHLLVHAHMIAAGYLMSSYLIGLDPMAHRARTRMRVGLLLVVFAGHDVLAKLMYAWALPVAGTVDDVRSGAMIMYYGGDLIEMFIAVVLLTQWYRASGRVLARQARRAQQGEVQPSKAAWSPT